MLQIKIKRLKPSVDRRLQHFKINIMNSFLKLLSASLLIFLLFFSEINIIYWDFNSEEKYFLPIDQQFSEYWFKTIDDIDKVPGFLITNPDNKYLIHKNVWVWNYRKWLKSSLSCVKSDERVMFSFDNNNNVYIYCVKEEWIIYPKFWINNTSYFWWEKLTINWFNFDKKKTFFSLWLVNKNWEIKKNKSWLPIEIWLNVDNIDVTSNSMELNVPLVYNINWEPYYLFDTEIKKIRLNMFYLSCVNELQISKSYAFKNFCWYSYYRQYIDIPLKSDDSDPVSLNQYYLWSLNIEKVWNKYWYNLIDNSEDNLWEIVIWYLDDWVWFKNNPDFDGKIYVNNREIPWNWIDDDWNWYVDDVNWRNFIWNNNDLTPNWWHWTNWAWLIAAKHWNNYWIKWIAPNVKIMPLIICNKNWCPRLSTFDAMKYAIENWADIINLSISWWYSSDYNKYVKLAKDNNVILVVAWWNNWTNTSEKKVSPVCNWITKNDIIWVWATSQNWEKLKWSSYGSCIDTWAPWEKIFTAPIWFWYTNFDETQWTSFSSPITAWIIALWMWLNNQIDSWKIIKLLQKNTNKNISTWYYQLDVYRYIKDLVKTYWKKYIEKNREYKDSWINKILNNIPEKTFSDLNPETEEWKAADYLSKKWIIWWYPDWTFKWSKNVNRAEAAKFLILAYYWESFSTSYYTWNLEFKTMLSDVDQDQWYAWYVNKAVMDWVIKWYWDNTFKPWNNVNTVEFLKMISKIFYLEENLKYSFLDVSDSDWFSKYAWIVEKYNLFPNRIENLNPWKFLTREEVSIAIYNLKIILEK